MRSSKKILTIALVVFSSSIATAQQQISLEECYRLARENYPLIKKQNLITSSARYSLENASKIYLPQLSVNGQVTYQSQTIDFSKMLPPQLGLDIPSLSKDQYKVTADAGQLIYDGGVVKTQKQLIAANAALQEQSVEVNLHAINERISDIYFSILLIEQQLKQNEIRKTDLNGALDKAKVAYDNGVGFRSNVDELKAALINVDMAATEFRAQRKAFLNMLSMFVGKNLDENTALVIPDSPATLAQINRPELKLFDLQKKQIDVRQGQLETEYKPKLNAFAQAGYGRPGLNFVENKSDSWWMGGIRLSWPFGSLYSLKNNKTLLQIEQKSIDVDREVFLFNTQLALAQQNGLIQKYRELLKQDEEVIALLSSVVQSAKRQLDNGVITVHEYIAKLNEENLAKQSRIVHQVQLIQAQYQFKNTSGN